MRSFEEIGKLPGSDALNEAYQLYATMYLTVVDDNLRHFFDRMIDVRPLRKLNLNKLFANEEPTDEDRVKAYNDAAIDIARTLIDGKENEELEKLFKEEPALEKIRAEILKEQK